jgi:hypothetical protein
MVVTSSWLIPLKSKVSDCNVLLHVIQMIEKLDLAGLSEFGGGKTFQL